MEHVLRGEHKGKLKPWDVQKRVEIQLSNCREMKTKQQGRWQKKKMPEDRHFSPLKLCRSSYQNLTQWMVIPYWLHKSLLLIKITNCWAFRLFMVSIFYLPNCSFVCIIQSRRCLANSLKQNKALCPHLGPVFTVAQFNLDRLASVTRNEIISIFVTKQLNAFDHRVRDEQISYLIHMWPLILLWAFNQKANWEMIVATWYQKRKRVVQNKFDDSRVIIMWVSS